MLRSIAVTNLRGIQNGELRDLTPLVVLVGPNNSGKSTILDAVMIACSADPGKGLAFVLQRRSDLQQSEASRWLLWQSGGRAASQAKITVVSANKFPREVKIVGDDSSRSHVRLDASSEFVGEPKEDGSRKTHTSRRVRPKDGGLSDISEVRLIDLFSPAPRPPLHALYTEVAERGLRQQAKAIITDLATDIRDVEILTRENVPVVYFIYEDGARPEATVGDGIRFLLRVSFELAAPVGGLVLLEEPEMHMHPAAIRQVARAIFAAMRRGIQIMLTTHSLEIIDALLSLADDQELDKMAFYRVKLDKGQLKTHRLSGRETCIARTEVEEDLR